MRFYILYCLLFLPFGAFAFEQGVYVDEDKPACQEQAGKYIIAKGTFVNGDKQARKIDNDYKGMKTADNITKATSEESTSTLALAEVAKNQSQAMQKMAEALKSGLGGECFISNEINSQCTTDIKQIISFANKLSESLTALETALKQVASHESEFAKAITVSTDNTTQNQCNPQKAKIERESRKEHLLEAKAHLKQSNAYRKSYIDHIKQIKVECHKDKLKKSNEDTNPKKSSTWDT